MLTDYVNMEQMKNAIMTWLYINCHDLVCIGAASKYGNGNNHIEY